jgi:hypothetical protein
MSGKNRIRVVNQWQQICAIKAEILNIAGSLICDPKFTNEDAAKKLMELTKEIHHLEEEYLGEISSI